MEMTVGPGVARPSASRPQAAAVDPWALGMWTRRAHLTTDDDCGDGTLAKRCLVAGLWTAAGIVHGATPLAACGDHRRGCVGSFIFNITLTARTPSV